MGFRGGKIKYKNGGRSVSVSFLGSVETEDFSLSVGSFSENGGGRVSLVLTPKTELTLTECSLETDESLTGESAVFLNGYQTWTESAELPLNSTIPRLNALARPLIGMYGDYGFRAYRRGTLRSWTYTYIREKADGGRITLYGSVSEKTGFTVFEYGRKTGSLRVIKDCRGLALTVGEAYSVFDIFTIKDEENAAFDAWFASSGVPKPRVAPCTGWTSWYNYYTKVTQEDVLKNLAAFSSRNIGADYFQIDDGYQQAVGDWLRVNEKFPRGMAYLADEIHKAGYKAGLWLAPIICEKRSRIYKEHPDWAVSKAGFNPGWSGMFYALDFYNPEVRGYLREVFDTVLNKWGYDMVKLDFLYAACLAPREDKTRGQVMYEFFSFLREISGDKVILGCGAQLGSAFGLFDYCRVSSDVALKWEDKFLSKLHYRERVSTVNALTSTIGRHQLNGRAFLNDPDVFILRNGNNRLTEEQKRTLFMINGVLGGLVFTSDDLDEYTDGQAALFRSMLNAEPKRNIKVEKAEVVNIYYTAGSESFCLMSNLSARRVTAKAPFAGVLQEDGGTAEKSGMISLRPYQTVCLRRPETV